MKYQVGTWLKCKNENIFIVNELINQFSRYNAVYELQYVKRVNWPQNQRIHVSGNHVDRTYSELTEDEKAEYL
jgi:hypothetical protein